MKNRWYLILVIVLMIFINNEIFAQNGDDISKESFYKEAGFTKRIIVDWPSINWSNNNQLNWLNDTSDLIGSLANDRTVDSIDRLQSLRKATDNEVDSLIKLVTSTKKEDEDNSNRALDELQHIDSKRQIPAIENIILTKTYDSCAPLRSACLGILDILNSKSSMPIFIKALDEKSFEVRIGSALTLAHWGEKVKSFNTLKTIWYSSIGNKTSCHDGFMDIGTPDAINMLRIAMDYHQDPIVSLDAAACMAELGYKEEAFFIVKELLYNKDYRIRESSMKVLAYYIGDNKSFDLIKGMLNDKDKKVVNICQMILRKYKL